MSPDPCDRTSAFPPARENLAPSDNHPRGQSSLALRHPRRLPVQLAARWSVKQHCSEHRLTQSQAVRMQWCAWPAPLLNSALALCRSIRLIVPLAALRGGKIRCGKTISRACNSRWYSEQARSVATAAIDRRGNSWHDCLPPNMAARFFECVTIVGVVRIFFETARKSDPGSGLAVSIYQSAIFSALALMIGVVLHHSASRDRRAENVRHRRTLTLGAACCEPYSRSLARQYFLATATRLSQRGLYCAFC